GRRVVRVHGATDAMTSLLKSFIANYDGDSLVLIEAGELGSRSSLRRLFEQAKTAAALPCYSDTPRSLGGVIAESLSQHGLTAAPDALNFLRENLGADRGVTRNELEKLSIYMASGSGGSTTVTLDDARAAVGDNAATSLDEIVYAALGGDRGGMDRSLARAFGEGVTAVSVLRAAARHLQRLILARGLIDGGRSPEQAMAALRPPVIFLFSDRFRAQLGRWSRSRLAQALDLITEAELQCKSSGPPPEAVCGRALMRVAQSAGRGR
ncbi:MAG: DNA polymerase III subunit delta, partial [Rhodospirillales bacterium]|nr:DNA polymerase III subunit delta [Rhodospirillales bacterium]